MLKDRAYINAKQDDIDKINYQKSRIISGLDDYLKLGLQKDVKHPQRD